MGYQRTIFTVGPVYARDHGPGLFPLLEDGTGRQAYRRVLEDALIKMVPRRREPASPRSPGGPQVRPEDLVAQHT